MKVSGHVKLFSVAGARYEDVQGWRLVAAENQKVNRNQIWKKLVCSTEVMRNHVKLLVGSGQRMEEGTLGKFEREEHH